MVPGRGYGVFVAAGGLDMQVGPGWLRSNGDGFHQGVEGRAGRFAAVQADNHRIRGQGVFDKCFLAGLVEQLRLGAGGDGNGSAFFLIEQHPLAQRGHFHGRCAEIAEFVGGAGHFVFLWVCRSSSRRAINPA